MSNPCSGVATGRAPRFEDLPILLCLGVGAGVTTAAVVWWRLMSSSRLSALRLTCAAAACSALLAIGVSSATAAPATDAQGYVDSTARCASPNVAVVFGRTKTSRVAICETPSGGYQYRGVRVRDGAKLILSASRSGNGGFVAENDGTDYTVTASALVVSMDGGVIRKEPMVEFYGSAGTAGTSGTKAPTGTTTTTTTTTATPTTTTATTTTATTTTATPTTTTSTTPLPAPLPAEVGSDVG